MEIKHTIGIIYTREEVVSMYGEEFFESKKTTRPVKPKIKSFNDFDEKHRDTYLLIAMLIQKNNIEPVEVWAFGSRVRGNWMLPEEDPRGRGSDWDVFTTADLLPDANMLDSCLSGVRIDFRKGTIPPKEAVRIPS